MQTHDRLPHLFGTADQRADCSENRSVYKVAEQVEDDKISDQRQLDIAQADVQIADHLLIVRHQHGIIETNP